MYSDFVSFVRKVTKRVNNRYGQELKSSPCAVRERKESG